MIDWKRKLKLKADPTEWLLEPEDAPIRYWTLVDLLDRPDDDEEVREAKASIPSYPPVARLLANQRDDGHWGKPDYYLPRTGEGTLWVLTVLGDLGLTAENEHVLRACEFMFTHQHENGVFARQRQIPGEGYVWQTDAAQCTHARIVRFLLQFGYADDERVRKALDWLLPSQRKDGMWFCRDEGQRGCLRATIDVLRLAAIDPQTASHPGIPQAAGAVIDLLMEPRMSRYHIGEAWGTWERLKYPYFGFSLLNALDALARLGYTPREPKIAASVEYLRSRQRPDGKWIMDESWPCPPIDFGVAFQPNKWLTLDAMRVLKLLHTKP